MWVHMRQSSDCGSSLSPFLHARNDAGKLESVGKHTTKLELCVYEIANDVSATSDSVTDTIHLAKY